MPVAFEELVGYPQVRIDTRSGTFRGIRKFKINWSDSIEFYKELCGYYEEFDGIFQYVPPTPFPGIPQAICTGFDLDAFPEDYINTPCGSTLSDDTNQPLYGLVTATYTIDRAANNQGSPPAIEEDLPPVPDGTFLTWEEDIGGQMLTIPGRAFKWNRTGLAVPSDVAPGLFIPSRQYSFAWDRVPVKLIPQRTIARTRGSVNSTKLGIHPAGCALFLGARIRRQYQFSGDVLANVTYTFDVVEKIGTDGGGPFGWNYFYNPDDTDSEKWDTIKTVTGDKLPFQSKNHNDLFKFDGS